MLTEDEYNGEYYEDYLRGEYAYSENGIIIIDTLEDLPDDTDDDTADGGLSSNTQITETSYNNIGGRYVSDVYGISCFDCTIEDRYIGFYFIDPERKYLNNRMIIDYLEDETDPEKISIILKARDGARLPYEGAPIEPRVP
jgi:hypothetical protein